MLRWFSEKSSGWFGGLRCRDRSLSFFAVSVACLVSCAEARAQTTERPDLRRQPTLYVVGYAHLDTEWRWEYPQVINEYIRKTMEDNFKLFEKYPHYVFNFSGANRYRFMKEYYPADFAKVKTYVESRRWFPAGSSMEEGDVNAPSAEAIIRQVLYGNNWFRKEFGKASAEYMLPDCFGFPVLATDHPGALGRERLLDTKAGLGILGRRRWSRLQREDAGGYAL